MSLEDQPVLIVGAGPTGLTMANLLALWEIPFVLIDTATGPSRDSKAFGIHARTLEIFEQLGIADEAIRQGSIDHRIHVFIKDQERATIRMKELLPGESSHPYFLILPQDRTEKLLSATLELKHRQIQWQHELVDLEQLPNGVVATMKDAAGREHKSQFQYVIGCDGAGSTVREKAGFTFEGKTFSPTFYLADITIKEPFTHGDIYATFAPDHMSLFFSFPEKDRYRLFNFLNASVGKSEDEELTREDVQRILDDDAHLPITAHDMEWSSVFRIHARITNSFHNGKILLAGDAAHVHSPAAAQGMNTGIQDAYALAWRLAMVLKKHAVPELLDTYDEERRPIARNLHYTTDRFFQLMISRSAVLNFFRLNIFPGLIKLIMNAGLAQKSAIRRFSQLAISYKGRSLNKQGDVERLHRHAPLAGDRAPFCRLKSSAGYNDIFELFHYTHYTMLITARDQEDEEAQAICSYFSRTAELPMKCHFLTRSTAGKRFFKTYGIKDKAVYIIRPDGHIGYRSAALDPQEIEIYFDKTLGREWIGH